MARKAPPSRARASSRAPRRLALAALALVAAAAVAAPAPAAADQILEFTDGACTARINSKGVAVLVNTAACKKAQQDFDNDFDLPQGDAAARAAPAAAGPPAITVKPEGDTASPLGTYYTVTWSGVSGARSSDRIVVLIGRYTKSLLYTLTMHPRSFVFAAEVAPDTWAAGSGSTRMYLPLLREPVTFAYIRRDTNTITNKLGNLWRNFQSIAQVYVDPPAADPPHNVRLSLVPTAAGTPIKAAAIWQQRKTITGASVQWRTESSEYGGAGSGSAAATPSSYKGSNMCTEPATKAGFISPNQIYRGTITGLAYNTRYYYQVGSNAAGWSAEKSFLTPPAANDASATMRVLLLADSGMYTPDNTRVPNGNSFAAEHLILSGNASTPGRPEFTVVQAIQQSLGLGPGQQPGSRAVVDGMKKVINEKPVHFVVNSGDLSYARGEFHQWDLWFAQFGEQVASKVVVAYTPGNHEAASPLYADSPYNGLGDIDAGGECNVPTRRLLQMAQPSGATSDWHSSDWGPVHWVQLNSEQHLKAGSKQRAWLEADLKAVDRTKTPWIVVSLHRPVFVDSNDGGDQKASAALRSSIEPLLAKYQVDLVFAGHIHSGQRSCIGVLKGTCVGLNTDGSAKGPTYLLTGQSGYQSPLGAFKTKPTWEEFLTYDYGYAEALVSRTSFTMNTYKADGTLLDTATLNKPVGWRPNQAQAEALYAATAAWVVPETVDTKKLWAVFSVKAVLGALSSPTWRAKYLTPDTEFWKILNSLPGKDGYEFSIQQVWQVSAALYELTRNELYNLLPKDLTKGVQYMYDLLSPGGRMYYGP